MNYLNCYAPPSLQNASIIANPQFGSCEYRYDGQVMWLPRKLKIFNGLQPLLEDIKSASYKELQRIPPRRILLPPNKKTVRRVIGVWLTLRLTPHNRKPYLGYRFAKWLSDGGY